MLQGLDYKIVRRRGSHVRLRKVSKAGEHLITVPFHKELAKGTLNDILKRVSERNQIPKEKLIEKLKER